MEILFRMLEKVFLLMKKSLDSRPKKTVTPLPIVADESISAIKVKEKTKDKSVPFAYTGYTESFVSKETKKIPSKEKQNPSHVTRTYDPHTHEMTTVVTEYDPFTFETTKKEMVRSVETVEDYQKRIEEELRNRLNSKMATANLYSRGYNMPGHRNAPPPPMKKQK